MGADRRPLVAANWKMHGTRAAAADLTRAVLRLVGGTTACDIVLCPPATLLHAVGEIIAGSALGLGGQDCHAKPFGAFTGDIAAPMLADLACRHVIIGHSERRAGHGETDADVRAKADAALASGLTPILCIGETEAQRLAGQEFDVIARQLAGSIPPGIAPGKLVLAYEPIWAIGTGRAAALTEVEQMHRHIRDRVAALLGDAPVRILYGGSVKPANAAGLLHLADVDGALVGGASLDAAEFAAIIAAAAAIK